MRAGSRFVIVVVLVLTSCVDADVQRTAQALEGLDGPRTWSVLSTDEAWDDLRTVHADAAIHRRSSDTLDGIPVRYTAGGLLRSIVGPDFRVAARAYGTTASATPREAADIFIHRYAALWGVAAGEFDRALVKLDHHASPLGRDVDRVTYAQVHDGHSVVGAAYSPSDRRFGRAR